MSPRRRRLLVGLSTVLVIGAACFAYGRWIEPSFPVTEEIAVEIPGLPGAADGFRIAFVSDLHVREIGARERRLREIVEAADVDLVLVGGDLVDVPYWMTDYVHRATLACSLVAELPSRLGTIAVWGNNDIPEATASIAEAYGIDVLENEQRRVPVPGGELCIVGIDDPVTRRASFEEAFSPPPTDPYIAIAHSPDGFPEAAERNVPLLLVGHTHGGQVWFPSFLPAPRRLLRLRSATPHYRAGLYRSGSSRLYVTRGVGTSYVHFRFLCRPEVTLVTLRSPPGRK